MGDTEKKENKRGRKEGWTRRFVKRTKQNYSSLFSAIKSNFRGLKDIAGIFAGHNEDMAEVQLNQEYVRLIHRINLAGWIASTVVIFASVSLYWFGMVIRVDGISMMNTLQDKQAVMCQRTKDVSRGDIVTFHYYDEEEDETDLMVKRIIAMGGDTVSCSGGKVFVNGAALEEGYALGVTDDFEPLTVPNGEIFVLGDNREYSMDSREIGTVSKENVVARLKGVH